MTAAGFNQPWQNLGRKPSDWLRHELDREFNRESIIVKGGSGESVTGTPIAMIDDNGVEKYVPYNPDGTDGSEVIKGCLLNYVDATADDVPAVLIKGKVVIVPMYLTWPASVDDDAKVAAGVAALKALGMETRPVV